MSKAIIRLNIKNSKSIRVRNFSSSSTTYKSYPSSSYFICKDTNTENKGVYLHQEIENINISTVVSNENTVYDSYITDISSIVISNSHYYSFNFYWDIIQNRIERNIFHVINPIKDLKLPSIFKDIRLLNDYSALEDTINSLNFFINNCITNNPLIWAIMWWISVYSMRSFHDIVRRYGLMEIYNNFINNCTNLLKLMISELSKRRALRIAEELNNINTNNIKVKELCTININKIINFYNHNFMKKKNNRARIKQIKKIVNKFVFNNIFKNIIEYINKNNNVFNKILKGSNNNILNTIIANLNNNTQVYMMANHANPVYINLVWFSLWEHSISILPALDGSLVQVLARNSCLVLDLNNVNLSIFTNNPNVSNHFFFVKVKLNNVEYTAVLVSMFDLLPHNRLVFPMPTHLFNTYRNLLMSNGQRLSFNIISTAATHIYIIHLSYNQVNLELINSNTFLQRSPLLFSFDIHNPALTIDIRFIRLSNNRLFFFDFNCPNADTIWRHNTLIQSPVWIRNRVNNIPYFGFIANDISIEQYPDDRRSLTVEESWLSVRLSRRNLILTRGYTVTGYKTTTATSNIMIMIHIP